MFKWLKGLFTKKPRKDAVTWDMRESHFWGNNIQWFDVKTRRIVGWCEPIPRDGDLLKSPMKSGRVGVGIITKVEPTYDPPDMFFATVVPYGYEDEGVL